MNIFKNKKPPSEDNDSDTPEYLEKLQYRVRSPQHKRFSTAAKDGKVERQSSKELDYLPDGSHISPLKCVTKGEDGLSAVRKAEYVGSFAVTGEDQNARADLARKKLAELKDGVKKSKPVLLVISLSGIKVCSHTGESVYMAHALKRISYATCDPEVFQFSFLAREPKGRTDVQYCHAFTTKTAQEAEELNTIVGNAFKMAYAAQREKEQPVLGGSFDMSSDDQGETPSQSCPESPDLNGPSPSNQPTFNQIIAQQLEEQRARKEELQHQQQEHLKQQLNRISTPNIEEQLKERRERRQREKEEIDREAELARLEGKTRMTWAKHVAQKTCHKIPAIDGTDGASGSKMNGSSPSHDPSQQPKFHSIVELREAMDAGSLRSYGSPVMTLKETIDNHFCDFSSGESGQEGLGGGRGETRAEVHQVMSTPANISSYQYHGNNGSHQANTQSSNMIDRPLPNTPVRGQPERRSKTKGQRPSPKLGQLQDSAAHYNTSRSRSQSGSRSVTSETSSKRFSGRYQNDSPMHSRSNSSGSEIPEDGDLYQSPPNPIRYDSIRKLDPRELPVDEELKGASWYQHGIPREIALEILNQQDIGSFIVRDSTTHPSCYALSVKVPKFDNPTGISHYLIIRDAKRGGIRLKGLDKVWPSLTALVTHHTVMPEMLPCTLRLPRNSSNPVYREREDEREENYQKITDFSGMLHEMKI